MFLVLFLGPPGVGKGTVSHKLVSNYGFVHFSTGKIFRALKDKNTSQGSLVSDDQVNALVLKEFEDMKVKNPDMKVVLDGYPRTVVQAEFFKKHFNIEKVFLLTGVSHEFIIQRLSNRLLCEHADHTYNLVFKPPKVEGICDIDGSKLYKRSDDTPEIVAKRLKVYEDFTSSLIDYYKKEGNLIEIDASKDLKNTMNQMLEKIKDAI